MKEGDKISPGPDPGFFIDKSDTGSAEAIEFRLKVIDFKGEMVHTFPPLFYKFIYW